MADNKFTVRFPTTQLIKDWSKFNPVKMRTARAKIQIESWNGSIGGKAELQMGWSRVHGIPHDKRSIETITYACSLVGAIVEVDTTSLGKIDYVRVKIVVRDICRIPETAEGGIIPYIYDFHFEREVENVEVEPKIEIQAPAGQGGDQLNPKKAKLNDQGPSQVHAKLQIECAIKDKTMDNKIREQCVRYLMLILGHVLLQQ